MNAIKLISKEEYNDLYFSNGANSEDLKFLNSTEYLEYSVNIGKNKEVIYIKFIFKSEVVLIFHILIRNPKFKGCISYNNPIRVSSKNRKVDSDSLNTIFLVFIKKLKLLLIKLMITRYVIEFLEFELSELIQDRTLFQKLEPQNTLVIDFDSSKPHNFSYNRSLKRTLNSTELSDFRLKSGNSLDIYIDFYLDYVRFENENQRNRRTLPITEIEDSYQYLPKKHYNYFTLLYNDKAISLLGIYSFNDVWTEINSSTSLYAFENKIPASHILHDMVLKQAHLQNAKRYDFAGLNNSNIDLKKKQINKFKYNFTKKIIHNSRIILYFPFF